MRIDLDRIDREEFVCEARQTPAGSLWLVCPRKMKLRWAPGEEHLRSLLCRPDGSVVSSGFPKFRNFGEDAEDDAITEAALTRGDVVWTEKVDGSLVIRSVVDDVVIWRTRGSHQLGAFEDAVMSLVRERWPALLDPRVGQDAHLLFELTGPDHRIVLRYDDPALTTLGFVVIGDALRIGSPDDMDVELLSACPPRARSHALPSGLGAARSEVAGWTDREGVVAWCRKPDGGHHLAKFKALRYLRLHSLRSHLTEPKTWALCHANGIVDADGLARVFAEAGLDWEPSNPHRPARMRGGQGTAGHRRVVRRARAIRRRQLRRDEGRMRGSQAALQRYLRGH